MGLLTKTLLRECQTKAMSETLVLIAESSALDVEARQVIATAIGAAGYQVMTSETMLGPNSILPRVVIATLGAGERKIPSPVVTLMNGRAVGVPLVLLCAEALSQNAVVLQGGRLYLVGRPWQAERVAAMLVRAADAQAFAALRDEQESQSPSNYQVQIGQETKGVMTRESLRPQWWVSAIMARALGQAAAPVVSPSFHQRFGEGLTALLPLDPTQEPHGEQIEAIGATVREDITIKEKQARLQQLCGDRVAVLHLSPAADSWVIFWPRPEHPLWLLSPLRLPNTWNVSASLNGRGQRLLQWTAASGDIFLAATAPLPLDPASAKAGTDTHAIYGAGGPALLDILERDLEESKAPFNGLIIEVR